MQSSDSLYSLHVRPNGRAIADEYLHQNNIWIEGREGSRYDIVIGNQSLSRALFIVAVDGLDVINGKPAGPGSRGYIVDAKSSLTIPGWKLNNQEAAEFYFSRKSDSYVTAIGGNTANTGVIGAMIFREAQTIDWAQHLRGVYFNGPQNPLIGSMTSTPWIPNNTFGSNINNISANVTAINMVSQSQAVSQDVGTGFGDAVGFNTSSASFTREDQNNPTAMLVMYYNTAKNLQKMGIQLRTRNSISCSPNPFPASTGTGCLPPKDWSR